MLIDPRHGDIEDDAASPGQRSLLAIAGSLLVEISLPKLLFAWTVLLLLPAVLLGLAPLLASAWFSKAVATACRTDRDRHGARFARDRRAGMDRMAAAVSDRRDQFLVAQRARRAARLRVRPRGVASSDGTDVGQEADPRRPGAVAQRQFDRRPASCCPTCAVLVAIAAWPASRWTGGWNDLVLLHRLAVPTLANAIVLVSAYLAVASLMWGFADASMPQPVDLAAFDTASSWRA